MKRFLLSITGCFLFTASSWANHITGGEMYYTYIGQNGGLYQYNVTLKLFRHCGPVGAPLDPSAVIAIFDRATGSTVWLENVPRSNVVVLNLGSPSPCISNPPEVCYEVGFYTFTVALPGTPNGYIIAYQRCCRIAGINNLLSSSSVGATYTAEIPGTSPLATGPQNNSARFTGADTVIVCANNPFQYSFGAIDTNNDSLRYSFCTAYEGGTTSAPVPNPPASPPYIPVPYNSPFSSVSPLGSGVSINPATGLISGIAPAAGIYVVTVCVTEFRNGLPIAVQRKDLQIKVGDCNIAAASLQPEYISCDGFSMTFQNLANSPLINSYFWDFGVPWLTSDTSILATPTFTYPDTGVFIVKLVTNRNQACSDSTTAIVRVFPGFFPDFSSSGICVNNPTLFTDLTTTNYGVVNSWRWDFGDLTTIADTSQIQNPTWTYSTTGSKNVRFIVTNSKGCIDTVFKTVDIIDKPPISLPFRDTLLCLGDGVQMQAGGSGVWSWTPLVGISNPNTANPTFNPSTTTTYYVQLNDNGCINNDSVRVRIITAVTLAAISDTTICAGDQIQLGALTDGLQFFWTPAGQVNNPNILNPIATTPSTTTYQIVATVGSCSATDFVTVSTVPYPLSNAGPDTTICYNTPAQLQGAIAGSSYNWTPAASLSNSTILNPIAYPPRTTAYVLTVYDTLGCPKPGRDTVIVNVIPKMNPFAGRDTSVIVGQPLQFNASGGSSYFWSPSTGLNNPNIADPIGVYLSEIDSIRYRVLVMDGNCMDSAFITVRVFKTPPYIFVPSAFTPNSDGLNDVIRPIAVGIKKINYFRIYNRWGQMVFSTTINGHGWDGKIGGREQGTNTFAWIVSAVDYQDKPIFQKGLVTLIR
jgi:gliding motility-associated-like protein